MLTKKQSAVLQFCKDNGGKITKRQAMSLIDTHWHNGAKHVGDCLSRMVRAGLLSRVSPGLYEIGKGEKHRYATVPSGQATLFE